MDAAKRAQNFVRVRGLPFSAGEADVRMFFEGLDIATVKLTTSADGRPSGEAYVEFSSPMSVEKALAKHQQNMGTRYIEVFPINEMELQQLGHRRQQSYPGAAAGERGFIKIRGLPYSCKKEDIDMFFKGVGQVGEIVFGREGGEWGKPTGEAFVRFDSQEVTDQAMKLNGQHIGNRYLELFRSDSDAFEMFKRRIMMRSEPPAPAYNNYALANQQGQYGMDQWAYYGAPYAPGYGYDYDYGRQQPPPQQHQHKQYHHQSSGGGWGGGYGYRYSPYDYHGRGYQQGGGGRNASQMHDGGGGGYGSNTSGCEVHMRGIPFRVTTGEIEQFFYPLHCTEIKVGYLEDGRASGDGIVTFNSVTDARQALERDRQMIGNRYIELFPAQSMKVPSGTRYKSIGGGKGKASYQQQQAYQQGQQAAASSNYQWSSAY